jgi:hypothetical protein
MLKKLTAIAILVMSIPVMAYAGATWSLNTWARSAGGSITVRGTSQTVSNSSVFNTYTTSNTNPISYSITVNTGYKARVYMNQTGTPSTEPADFNLTAGLNQTLLGINTLTSTNATLLQNDGTYLASLWVVFEPVPVSVGATALPGSHYRVNLTNVPNVNSGSIAGQNITFTFTADPGYLIQSIIGNTGLTDINSVSPTTINVGTTVAKVTFPKGYVFGSTIIALSATAVVDASTSVANVTSHTQNVVKGATGVAMAGTVTGAPASSPYPSWSVVAYPGGDATRLAFVPSASAATFTGYTTGTYVFAFNASATARALTSFQVMHTVPVVTPASIGSTCQACHTSIGIGGSNGAAINSVWAASAYNLANLANGCTVCHVGAGTGAHPGTIGGPVAGHDNKALYKCTLCHNSGLTGFTNFSTNGHNFANPIAVPGCVDCHSIGQNAGTRFVQDNNGVRVITGANGEFGDSNRLNTASSGGYRSHHIYNGATTAPQNAQCIACHLEGKAGPGRTTVVDATYHMKDTKVYLRSGNTAISADVAWDPANPNHTDMDNFCMSCHNSAGAVDAYANISSALKGMTAISSALPLSATNPFGDQLTNAYDQKVRPGVVDVYTQLDPSNPSHHAVRGKKYTGRTRYDIPANRGVASQAAFTNNSGAGNATLHNNGAGVLSAWQYFGTYSSSTGSASGVGPNNYPGSRTTLYDAGFFVATYTTLDGNTLGDDSSLHCGDCHSVGQWTNHSAKAITWNNTSTASGGSTIISTTAVIGAHGSKNEYMLRTSNGSDSLQKQSSLGKVPVVYTNGTYVCFLCHIQEIYGDNARAVTTKLLGTGADAEANSEDEHGGNLYVGGCNGQAYSGYGKKGTARYGVLVSGSATPAMGNVFAMSCAHCHNSGQQNFGGIHGATTKYITYSTNGTDVAGTDFALPAQHIYQSPTDADGSAYKLNVVQKTSYRFMGGESLRYQGGATADKWEVQTLNSKHREGCYNLSQTADKTHLWNTTNPQNAISGGADAIENNTGAIGSDSAWGVSDYTSTASGRFGQNNTASGWGSCNHHQGSTTTGPTAPQRVIQRPLVY